MAVLMMSGESLYCEFGMSYPPLCSRSGPSDNLRFMLFGACGMLGFVDYKCTIKYCGRTKLSVGSIKA